MRSRVWRATAGKGRRLSPSGQGGGRGANAPTKVPKTFATLPQATLSCHSSHCKVMAGLLSRKTVGGSSGQKLGVMQGLDVVCRRGGDPPPQVGWTTHHTFLSWAHTPAPNHLPHMDCSPPPRGTNARHRSPVAPLPKPPATKGTPGGGTLPQGRVGGGQLACLRAPPGGGLAFPPQPPTDRLRCVAPHWPLISLVGFDGASQARQSHAQR